MKAQASKKKNVRRKAKSRSSQGHSQSRRQNDVGDSSVNPVSVAESTASSDEELAEGTSFRRNRTASAHRPTGLSLNSGNVNISEDASTADNVSSADVEISNNHLSDSGDEAQSTMPRQQASNWIYSKKVGEDQKVIDVLADFRKGFRCPGGEVVIFTDNGWAWQMSKVDFCNASREFEILLLTHAPPRIESRRREEESGACIKWAWKLGPPDPKFGDKRIRTLQYINHVKQPVTPQGNILREILMEDPDLEKAALLYDTMFRIMCSSEPQFQDKLSLDISMDQKFIQEAVAVLTVACSHGATNAVAMVLENHFLRMGQRLWTYVAANPAFWLIVATRIKSTIIFKDALCHAVGLIDSRQFVDRDQFPEDMDPKIKDVCLLIEEKIRDLSKLKIKAEDKLLQHFPTEMYHPAALGYVPDRSVYSGQIYLWMTRSLVQQWLAHCISKDLHHRGDDGGILMYQTIRKGGDAYLTADALGNFNQAFVMSGRANSKPFHDALKSQKETAKTCLDEIMVDYSQSQKNKDASLGYLTCMTVEDNEYPWIRVPDTKD